MATEQNYQAAVNGGSPREKDYGNGDFLDHSHDPDAALRRIRTAGSISISPELFEKIYLSPQNNVKGDLRKTFGNPTPLALCGFLLSLSPLSCDLMGWRGAGGNGAAGTGSYYFFGGLLMLLGGIGEFIIGNTFPYVVFTSFGAFWLSFAATLTPYFAAYASYSPDPLTAPGAGLETVGFNSSFAFFQVFMGVLCFIYLICALRTNIVFVMIFATLVLAFSCLAGAYWQISNGNVALAGRLQVAAGAFTFITSMCGWWIFAAIMLAALDFPFQLPVGDLSHIIKGASQRVKASDSNV